MNMSVKELIKYIVKRLNEKGVTATRLKIIKFLYLIEVEYYSKYFKRLTDVDWISWNYGPYWMSFPDVISSIKEIEEERIQADKEFYSYKISSDIEVTNPLKGLDRFLADHPIDEWAVTDTRDLLNHVYFHTPPMINVDRGSRLNFDNIKAFLDAKARRQIKFDPVKLEKAKKQLRQLHQRIKEREPRKVDSKIHRVSNKAICIEGLMRGADEIKGN